MEDWSYSGDPSESELDALRFKIGDTDKDYPLYTDSELEYLMEEYEDENVLLFNIYTNLADRFSRDIKRSLGPASVDPTSRARYYAAKAKALEDKLRAYRGRPSARVSEDRWFRVGVHDNV